MLAARLPAGEVHNEAPAAVLPPAGGRPLAGLRSADVRTMDEVTQLMAASALEEDDGGVGFNEGEEEQDAADEEEERVREIGTDENETLLGTKRKSTESTQFTNFL